MLLILVTEERGEATILYNLTFWPMQPCMGLTVLRTLAGNNGKPRLRSPTKN